MKTKHTPGPWCITQMRNRQLAIESPYMRHTLAAMSNISEQQQWADARLIAAAPEMLAAIEQSITEITTLIARLPQPYKSNMQALVGELKSVADKARGEA